MTLHDRGADRVERYSSLINAAAPSPSLLLSPRSSPVSTSPPPPPSLPLPSLLPTPLLLCFAWLDAPSELLCPTARLAWGLCTSLGSGALSPSPSAAFRLRRTSAPTSPIPRIGVRLFPSLVPLASQPHSFLQQCDDGAPPAPGLLVCPSCPCACLSPAPVWVALILGCARPSRVVA